jgi:hypothetical protein
MRNIAIQDKLADVVVVAAAAAAAAPPRNAREHGMH